MNLSTLCLAAKSILCMPGAAYMYCLAALHQALHGHHPHCGILLTKVSCAAQQHSGLQLLCLEGVNMQKPGQWRHLQNRPMHVAARAWLSYTCIASSLEAIIA